MDLGSSIYNKDAQSVTCLAGDLTVKKSFKRANPKKKNNAHYDYYFDVEKCKLCPLKDGCYKGGLNTKHIPYGFSRKNIIDKRNFKRL